MRTLRVGVAVALSLVILGGFVVTEVPRSLGCDSPEDFPNYYFGGRRLLEGRPVYVELGEDVRTSLGCDGYQAYPADPPPTVALLSPLALLPYQAAWWTMALLSAVLMAAALVLTAREAGLRWDVAAAAAAVGLASHPFRFLVARNHMEVLVVVAAVLGWRAWRRGSDGAAGAWWGAATALKLFPGLLAVPLALRRRRGGLVAAVTAAALLAGGAVIVGPDDARAFLTEILPRSRRWYGVVGNYSLLSLGTALGGPWLGWALLAVGAVWLLPFYLGRATGPDRTWAAGTPLALLLSPLSWLNYLVLVLPVLVLVASRLSLRRPGHRWGLLGLCIGLAFWPSIIDLGSLVPTVLASSIPTVALVALFWVALRLPEAESPARQPAEVGEGMPS